MSDKEETCISCGRDLPESEWCSYCGFNNHKRQLGGWAKKQIESDIFAERCARGEDILQKSSATADSEEKAALRTNRKD